MISHRHRCIFIHIPKTAGTSIEKKLDHFDKLDYGVQDHTPISLMEPHGFPRFLRTAARRAVHRKSPATAWYKYRHQLLTPKQYRTYFKFAIVRNPWRRVLSWYRAVMSDERIRRKTGLTNLGRWRQVPEDCTLKQFLIEFESNWALRPQLYWLKDSSGKVAMDYIGRFENLESDFAHVCQRLAIENHQLPKMLVSEHTGMEEFDSELIDLVYRRYKEEILLFGYQCE